MNKKAAISLLAIVVVVGGVLLLNKIGPMSDTVNSTASAALYTPSSDCDTNVIRLNGAPVQYVHLTAGVPQKITYDFTNCGSTPFAMHNLVLRAVKIKNNGDTASLSNGVPLVLSEVNLNTGAIGTVGPNFGITVGEVGLHKIEITLKTTSGPAINVGLMGTYYFGG